GPRAGQPYGVPRWRPEAADAGCPSAAAAGTSPPAGARRAATGACTTPAGSGAEPRGPPGKGKAPHARGFFVAAAQAALRVASWRSTSCSRPPCRKYYTPSGVSSSTWTSTSTTRPSALRAVTFALLLAPSCRPETSNTSV